MGTILILDFGSQYSQLIARRIRELNIYTEIISYKTSATEISDKKPDGIILSGGPASTIDNNSPICDNKVFDLGIPVLGICYGLQLMVKMLGGKVVKSNSREYGKTKISVDPDSLLFKGISKEKFNVWMSHGDKVAYLPEEFKTISTTINTEFAAISNIKKNLYGIQFHPEVAHTENGLNILSNFCLNICKAVQNWTMKSFVTTAVESIRNSVGKDKVILALSGGVDSSVSAVLINKAIGDQLICVFVNNGLLRENEAERVITLYKNNLNLNLIFADEENHFLEKLKNIVDPEQKRKIIGNEFIAIFDKKASTLDGVKFLAQGTTYPDVIESISISGNPSAMIKSHHNVGGLPEKMKLKLLEPIRCLFKDEVRKLGLELGMPKEMVMRQPFPGPGLAVRIIGDITKDKLDLLRKADSILTDEIKKADFYYKVWQSFAVLLPIQTVGVMGDERTYDNVVALRIVESSDGMTADWAKIPHELLEKISSRIVSEVKGINRVVYDITSKPPSTIEWE